MPKSADVVVANTTRSPFGVTTLARHHETINNYTTRALEFERNGDYASAGDAWERAKEIAVVHRESGQERLAQAGLRRCHAALATAYVKGTGTAVPEAVPANPVVPEAAMVSRPLRVEDVFN